MKTQWYIRIVLIAAGAMASLIGVNIALAPAEFYQSYGVILTDSTNLYSELRGMGSLLLSAGIVIGAGGVWRSLRSVALGLALILYGGIAAGRLLSIGLDQMPGTEIQVALAIEGVTFVLTLMAFGLYRQKTPIQSNVVP